MTQRASWIKADLGSAKTFDVVRVGGGGGGTCLGSVGWTNWGTAVVQTSTDDATWTTVATSISYVNSKMTNINFASTTARYIRINNSTWLGSGQFRVGLTSSFPADPASPSFAPASYIALNVNWTSGGAPLTRVTYLPGGTAPGACFQGTYQGEVAGSSLVMSDVQPGSYSLRICGVDSGGNMSPGTTITASTVAAPAPCASGTDVIVGLTGRVGAYFDQLIYRCATLSGGVLGTPRDGTLIGFSSGGSPFSVSCPANAAAVGIDVDTFVSAFTSRMRLHCANVTNGTTSTTAWAGSNVGTTTTYNCPVTQYVNATNTALNQKFTGVTSGISCW